MRYRVVIEVDSGMSREQFNKAAKKMAQGEFGEFMVYLATEVVNSETIADKRYVDN